MKSLSRFTALAISIMLICTMTAAQILYCLHSTLMSSEHFSRLLEDDRKLTELTTVLYSSLIVSKDSSSKDAFLKKYIAKVLTRADQVWIKSQVYLATKGIHQYVFNNASTLPTLDIIPLKKVLRDEVVSDIMSSDEANQKTEKIKTILSVLNNKYLAKVISLGLNNQLISMLLELSPVRSTGFDRATIHETIRIYLSLSNKNISLDQASYSIAEQMTADMLRLNKLKDYLDLNLFLNKSFGENNPLKTLKSFAASADNVVSRAVSILFWCTLLLLAIHKRFQLTKIIRTLSFCFVISSAFVLGASALLINRSIVEGILSHMYNTQSAFCYISTKYLSFFIRDFGLYLALQAVLTGLLCAALLLLFSKAMNPNKKDKAFKHFPTLRLSLGVIAFMLIFTAWSYGSLINDIKTFKVEIGKLAETNTSEAIVKGLIEAGGMEFLNLIETKKAVH